MATLVGPSKSRRSEWSHECSDAVEFLFLPQHPSLGDDTGTEYDYKRCIQRLEMMLLLAQDCVAHAHQVAFRIIDAEQRIVLLDIMEEEQT